MNSPRHHGIPTSPILRYFTAAHLRPELAGISEQFAHLAAWIELHLPPGAEKTTALRKLLESKDAAVRAGLDGMWRPESADNVGRSE